MTPAEVASRVLRAVQARAERSGIGARDTPQPDLAAAPVPWIGAHAGIAAAPYVAAAERIASRCPSTEMRIARRIRSVARCVNDER